MHTTKAKIFFQQKNYKEAYKLYSFIKEKYNSNSFDYQIHVCKKNLKEKEINILDKELKSTKKTSTRVLFITAGLKGPTAGGGIATTFHSMISTISSEQNISSSILYVAHPYYSKGTYEDWKNYYEKECNSDFLVIDTKKKHYGSQEMTRSFEIMKYLIKYELEYDTVVFHDFGGLAYFSLLMKKHKLHFKNTKLIISAHGNNTLSSFYGRKKVKTWNEKAVMFMERSAIELAEEITTPSEYYKNWLQRNFNARNVFHMPNIILNGESSENTLKISFEKERSLLVFYGRFERLKGIDIFINSLLQLELEEKVYNVLFAGNSTKIDGVDSVEYIKKHLGNYNGETQFLLNCKSEDLYEYVKRNKGLCVFPTLGETSSCVVVECILKNIKFIASDIPGIKELITKQEQKDFLFTAGNVELLGKAIKKRHNESSLSTLSFNMEQNKQEWVNFFLKDRTSELNILQSKIEHNLVSVIIPTADRSSLLKESLESIVKQTYKNIEIIVVDDASKNSKENQVIAQRFNAKYILAPHKMYKGAICNLGVKESKGKYICFFDDDDIAKPEMISNYMTAYNSDKTLDIISGFADVFEHEEYMKTKNITSNYTSLALGGGLEVNFHINFFGKGTFIIKKDSFIEVGGYEIDNDSVPMVDYRFYIKAALSNCKISIIPTGQYFYRKNSPNSLFYINKDKAHLQYLAKKSMENIIEQKLGFDIAKGFSSMLWDVSLPHYQ